MKKSLLSMIGGTYLAFVPAAYGFCSEPSAPSSWSKPTKPAVPYCVNEWAGTHTCDDWEIDNYNSAIRSYNFDVENYIADLRQYVEDAIEYAKCEIANIE